MRGAVLILGLALVVGTAYAGDLPRDVEVNAIQYASYAVVIDACSIDLQVYGQEGLAKPECQVVKRNSERLAAMSEKTKAFGQWLQDNPTLSPTERAHAMGIAQGVIRTHDAIAKLQGLMQLYTQ